MDKNPLLELIITEEDRQEAVDFLDKVYQGLYKSEGSQSIISENKKYGPPLLQTLGKPIEEIDNHDASQMIGEIIAAVKELPRIEIILATPPTEATLSEIADFVKTKSNEKSVVEITIDPAILGGAIFMIDGKYLDMSVAGKLDQSFKNNNVQDFLK